MKYTTFLRIIKIPLIVFVIFFLSLFTPIYQLYPWTDLIFHFAGGVSIALAAINFLNEFQKNNKLGKIDRFPKFLFIISLVALAAVLWEFAEFTNDLFSPIKLLGQINDTLVDLALGILGGIVTASIKSKEN